MAIRLARFEAIGEAIEEVEAYANERHDGSDYVQASADLAERLGHLRGRLRATDKASPVQEAIHKGETYPPLITSEAQSPSVRDVLEAVVGAGFRYTPSLHGQPTLWCLDCGRDSGTHYPTCKRDLLNAPRSGEASPDWERQCRVAWSERDDARREVKMLREQRSEAAQPETGNGSNRPFVDASGVSAHDAGHPHLVGGEFQSDKYPTCPRGKVPLSVKDPTAQDLLWEYAQRRRPVDAEFATDLEKALRTKGYEPKASPNASPAGFPVRTCKTCGYKTCSTSTVDFCTKCRDSDGLRPKHFLTRDEEFICNCGCGGVNRCRAEAASLSSSVAEKKLARISQIVNWSPLSNDHQKLIEIIAVLDGSDTLKGSVT